MGFHDERGSSRIFISPTIEGFQAWLRAKPVNEIVGSSYAVGSDLEESPEIDPLAVYVSEINRPSLDQRKPLWVCFREVGQEDEFACMAFLDPLCETCRASGKGCCEGWEPCSPEGCDCSCREIDCAIDCFDVKAPEWALIGWDLLAWRFGGYEQSCPVSAGQVLEVTAAAADVIALRERFIEWPTFPAPSVYATCCVCGRHPAQGVYHGDLLRVTCFGYCSEVVDGMRRDYSYSKRGRKRSHCDLVDLTNDLARRSHPELAVAGAIP